MQADRPAFDLIIERENLAADVDSFARYGSHTNAKQPILSQIRGTGDDGLEEMQAPYAALDADGDGVEFRQS